jgi:excisionase family DNA binding protein
MSDQSAARSGQDAPNAAATTPITVEQAAAVLGVSVTTVKRRIRAGTLQAEQARRPQGTVWLVYLPAAATLAAEERPPAASVAATAPTTSPAADAMVSLIQTTISTVLGPLVAELAATRQDGTRKDVIIREQAETIGELRATVATLEARTAVQTVVVPTEPPVTWRWLWARWWPLLATVVVAIVVAVAVLWPR